MKSSRNAIVALVALSALTLTTLAVGETALRDDFRRRNAASLDALTRAREIPSMPGSQAGIPADVPGDLGQLWHRESWFYSMQNYLRQGTGPVLGEQVPHERRANSSVRVLVLGDSFLHGTGVADLDTIWARQLQGELDRRWGRGSATVELLARDNASTMEEVEWLEQRLETSPRPDVILLGYVYNDPVPSFRENSVCRGVLDCRPQMPETHPRFQACLRGEDGFAGLLFGRVLGAAFPALSRELLSRYCDLDRYAEELGTITQQQVVDDPVNNPYWTFFTDAVSRLRTVADGIPVLIMPTPVNAQDVTRFSKVRPALQESGFTVVDPQWTLAGLGKLDVGSRRANPVDGHPGPGLAALYALDAADALSRAVNGERLAAATKDPATEEPLLIGNYLPTTLAVSELDRSSAVVVNELDETSVRRHYQQELTVAEHPEQYAPCMAAGRPHARIMLHRTYAGRPLHVELRSGDSPMTVVGVGYGQDGSPFQQVMGQLRVGAGLDLPAVERMTGLLLVPLSGAVCDLGTAPVLGRFEASITLQ